MASLIKVSKVTERFKVSKVTERFRMLVDV